MLTISNDVVENVSLNTISSDSRLAILYFTFPDRRLLFYSKSLIEVIFKFRISERECDRMFFSVAHLLCTRKTVEAKNFFRYF